MASSKRYHDEDWLRQQYTSEQRSMGEIGEMCGVSSGTIHNWIEKFGIQSRTRSEARTDGDVTKLHNKDWLEREYVENLKPATEIADSCGVTPDTVYSWLRKHGMEVRTTSESACGEALEKLNDADWLREKYINEGHGIKAIGDQLDVAGKTVYQRLMKYDIQTRPHPLEKTDADIEKLNDEEYLREQYCQDNSMAQIANEIDCHTDTVWRRFVKYGIEARGHDECHPSGPDHPQYNPNSTDNYGPNWDEKRLEARIRDHCRCQYCSIHDGEHIEKYNRVNHVHHIRPRREFLKDDGSIDNEAANRLDNLITLCNVHHKKLEGVPIDNRHNALS